MKLLFPVVILFLGLTTAASAGAQTLEDRLKAEGIDTLAVAARADGDARRGAIAFHQVHIGCAKCHAVDGSENSLGPDLTRLEARKDATDRYIVQSLLEPSASIRKGFETQTVLTADGRTITGLSISSDANGVKLRDPATAEIVEIPLGDIEEVVESRLSIMPAGVVNLLAGRQQFLDLAKYAMELRDGGVTRAAELRPPASLIAFRLPEYESHVDHAGLIANLDDEAFERGKAIYNRLCINCHGTVDREGSLPTALRFAHGKFRNGSDPFAMYQTLTHGFGLMVPQTWMVPQQKYDVIHYVRESLVRQHNESQYFPVGDRFLAELPKGDTFGPEPVDDRPWSDMDYGPWLFNTYEVGRDGSNIAYKGLAVRLDPGPGGVSRGNAWSIFDHDTMRLAGAWTHDGNADARFIDWHGIHFDGRHNAHPRVSGDIHFSNPTGPGWANPRTGSFEDDLRVTGRDERKYGPLPKWWSAYRGMHRIGEDVVVSYTVGNMEVLEAFDLVGDGVFTRTLELGPSEQDHTLLVATADRDGFQLSGNAAEGVTWGQTTAGAQRPRGGAPELSGHFRGGSWLQVTNAGLFNTRKRFTLTAKIRTKEDGVIFANTLAGDEWVPNGTTLFIRGGRLTYDMGWVGAVSSRARIDDGEWHDVAVTYAPKTGDVRLYVDRELSGSGQLKAKGRLDDAVFRIGFCAPNFPANPSFTGDIQDVRFFQRVFAEEDIQGGEDSDEDLVGHWLASADSGQNADGDVPEGSAPDIAGLNQHAAVVSSSGNTQSVSGLFAGVVGDRRGMNFKLDGRRLCLHIPPLSERRLLRLWVRREDGDSAAVRALATSAASSRLPESLSRGLTRPSRPLWPETLTTLADIGETNTSGFAVDTLTAPEANPWLARIRFGGHDFHDDGDRLIVCAWDGDVWQVTGIGALDAGADAVPLKWQRIASGLFQPLGVKIVDGDIYLTCRDQLVILRDSNGDGETDYYECFNNDQQVTEHFHEFAMGLQRDADGNFYYAKSARHALPALVPHHGTLLRVPPDGSRTDILANGFRAANGVCLNPDGTFIVTDQEGHWNPKNRINWVTEGGFYGNMFGYHDIEDDSDSAMQQPLCWITNAFDRSPAELLWVDSDRWGNLNGQLLNLSYGYGKVYVVPHEHLPGAWPVQGGMCEIPIPQFPTGTMRGRFHPQDGQLYVCGLFAWASSQQTKDGGLYRIRYEGRDAALPLHIAAGTGSLTVSFSDAIDPETAADAGNYSFRSWSLKRTANYGSKHYDERDHEVTGISILSDGRTVKLEIDDLSPTWCYELKCRLKTADGKPFERVIHGTIHELK